MKRKVCIISACLVLVFAALPLFAGGRQAVIAEPAEQEEISGVITIFHAGSLSVPFEVMEKNFSLSVFPKQ